MLRILLIIVVALAVIIGLMRLTGTKPGGAEAPAATTPVESTGDAVVETTPVETPEGAPAIGETVVEDVPMPAEETVDAGEEAVDALPDTATEPAPAAEEPAPETPGR